MLWSTNENVFGENNANHTDNGCARTSVTRTLFGLPVRTEFEESAMMFPIVFPFPL
jgi:hypothetical protein